MKWTGFGDCCALPFEQQTNDDILTLVGGLRTSWSTTAATRRRSPDSWRTAAGSQTPAPKGLLLFRGDFGGLSRKGTNGVSTNGVTANYMFFDRGTFWVLPLTFFLNLSKSITFPEAPLVLTPFVRNQKPLSYVGVAPGSVPEEDLVAIALAYPKAARIGTLSEQYHC